MMEYYSAMKRNEALIYSTTWMRHSSEAEPKKPGMKVHIILLLCLYEKSTTGKSVERGKASWLPGSGQKEE